MNKVRIFKDLWDPNESIGLYYIIPFYGSFEIVYRNIQTYTEMNVKYVLQDADAYMPFKDAVAVILEQMKYTNDLKELYNRVHSIMKKYVKGEY